MVTTVRFPDELHQMLKAAAQKQGMSYNAYLLSILWRYVEDTGTVSDSDTEAE